MTMHVGKERGSHKPIASFREKRKTFEILIEPKEAKRFLDTGNYSSTALVLDVIFSDAVKGLKASQDDIKEVFNTTDVNEIAKKIIKQGHLEIPQELKDEEKEKKIKQIIDFISRQAINPKTGTPHTPDRIKSAIEQVNPKIDTKKPAEEQAQEIVSKISSVIPIKIETKKIKVEIPASYTGKVYGLLKSYTMIKEEWNKNGSLSTVLQIPAGSLMSFFDKLNDITHGAALTEEVK